MIWYVYLNNVNTKEIIQWNIFSHSGFHKEVEEALATSKDRCEFVGRVNRILMYYFWSKAEYEVIITSWPPFITGGETSKLIGEGVPRYRTTVNLETDKKISVYDQVVMNFPAFIDYCWSFKRPTQKVKVRKVVKR